MPARKMRVELFDNEGNRYTVSFEGQITRDKALRLLDLVELLGGGSSGAGNPASNLAIGNSESSKFEKVRVLVQKHFPIVWFSSKEIQSIYEQEFKDPISISTAATYLARMASKGMLIKTGTPRSLKYKAVLNLSEAAIKQKAS